MAGRKFTKGRQNEQLLNQEMHQLYMSLKYLNYDRYKDSNIDTLQERQEQIPDKSLRFQPGFADDNIVEAYMGDNEWEPLFKGYYHPANLNINLLEESDDAVSYQLAIDPSTGTLKYKDPNTGWQLVSAKNYNGVVPVYNGLPFQFISPLTKVNKTDDYYPVPYFKYGKLFSNTVLKNTRTTKVAGYIPSINDGYYTPATEMGIRIKTEDEIEILKEPQWVHIDPSRLYDIQKRLIKIEKINSDIAGIIDVQDKYTEFYAFKKGDKCGHLLTKRDYEVHRNGIKLNGDIYQGINTSYDYIYAITYVFRDDPIRYGEVCPNNTIISKNNSHYIGDFNGTPSVFFNGLYFEKTYRDRNDNVLNWYVYNNGYITFDEKVTLEDDINMSILLFPNRTYDYTFGVTMTIVDEKENYILKAQEDIDNDGINEIFKLTDKTGSKLLVKGKYLNGVQTEPEFNPLDLELDETKITKTYVGFDENKQVYNTTTNNITVTLDLTELNEKDPAANGGILNWKKPVIFCNGLYLTDATIGIYDDFNISADGKTLTINNFQYIENQLYHFYIADIKDSYVCSNKDSEVSLDTGKYTIQHHSINDNKNYVIFVNGILLTSSSNDFIIHNSYIELLNTKNIDSKDQLEYCVLQVDPKDENLISLVFDSYINDYGIKIVDKENSKREYNDCNNAIVYLENGALLDQEALELPINQTNTYLKRNQIYRIVNDKGRYDYYIYNYNKQDPEKLSESEAAFVEDLIGYYSMPNTIYLLENMKDYIASQWGEQYQPLVSYYAYTYCNNVDETQNIGTANNIEVYPGQGSSIYNGKVNKLEKYEANEGALATYYNGLIMENKEKYIVDGKASNFSLNIPNLPIDMELSKKLNLLLIYKNLNDNELQEILDNNISYAFPYDNIVIKNDYPTLKLLKEALSLANYIFNELKNEHLTYIIEPPEKGEYESAWRDYIDFNKSSEQIYNPATGTIKTSFQISPGTHNIYLNGVLLEPSHYYKLDNDKIMLEDDICGLQALPSIEFMKLSLYDSVLSEKDKQYFINKYNNNAPILKTAVNEKGPYYIPSNKKDILLIEKREDIYVKTITFDILPESYSTYAFTKDLYPEIPKSLIYTSDLIKIYINGVLYDGDYQLIHDNERGGIQLIDGDALKIDPLYMYIRMNKLNIDYERKVDRITFEWR